MTWLNFILMMFYDIEKLILLFLKSLEGDHYPNINPSDSLPPSFIRTLGLALSVLAVKKAKLLPGGGVFMFRISVYN